jgi:hypothetical protein
MAVKAVPAWCLIASAKRNASESCSPATSRNSRPCPQARSCRSLLTEGPTSVPSAASTAYSMPMVRPIAVAAPAPPGASTCAAPGSQRPESALELGHHLPADQRPWRLAVPLSGGRCLEPQVGGLGRSRAGGRPDRRGSRQPHMPAGEDQQRPAPASDPPCRQRQRLAAGFSKSCEPPRSRTVWRSWACSGPSPDRG